MGPSNTISSSQEAYSLYREARSNWQKRSPLAIRMAIRSLEQAVSLDGAFASACALLAECYSILMDYGVISPREGMTAARLAVGRALKDGGHLAETLTASALVRQMDLDWLAAETAFRFAIEAHPTYTVARQRFALLLSYMGRDEESVEEITAAVRMGARFPAAAATEAWIPYYAGDFGRAIDAARKALGDYPAFSSASVVLGLSMVANGEPGEGVRILRQAFEKEPDNVSLLSLLAYAHGLDGDRKSADDLHRRLSERTKSQYVSPYYLAIPCLATGQTEEALSFLEMAMVERSPQLAYLAREPIFADLKPHPRFQAILGKIRLPSAEAEAGSAPPDWASEQERGAR
jgi:tetratricopeptide (TPR) repeat protein